MITKNCLKCGKEFTTTWTGRKYCSKTCSNIARTTKITKVCIVCGKEFKIHKFLEHSEKHPSLFCSHKCAALHHRKRIDRVCPVCGKKFESTPSQVSNGRGIHCSVECQRIGHKSGSYRSCAVCGKVFWSQENETKGGRTLCSWDCSKLYKMISGRRKTLNSAWYGAVKYYIKVGNEWIIEGRLEREKAKSAPISPYRYPRAILTEAVA